MRAKDLITSMEKLIESKSNLTDFKKVGYVLQIADGICQIYGLDEAMLGEVIKFTNSSCYGMVLNLSQDIAGVILFGDYYSLKQGDEAYCTGSLLSTKVGDDLLGKIVSVDDAITIDENVDKAFIEIDAPSMISRTKVDKPLETGIKAIDGLIPIGKGQRELIIGDRHTGKSSIAIDTIINQKDKDVISVYVSIGQRKSSIVRMLKQFKDKGVINNVSIVAATSSDSASAQFIAPYVGTAIAEHFMNQGKDVLIVYDDLSKHAVAYRELSLLLRRPPGRDAFPGDIFYIHAKLLERSAMLAKGGSLTSLPIVETLAGDVSAYIPTNIISITDGQIYLESSIFNEGIKPAINAGLSVSRVGGDAQYKSIKSVASKIKIELAQYKEVVNFAQFSSDLDETTKKQIERGKRIVEILKQDRASPVSAEAQVILFYAISNGMLDEVKVRDIKRFEDSIISLLKSRDFGDILNGIKDEKLIQSFIKEIIEDEGLENV